MSLKQKLFSIALVPFLIALIALGSIINSKYEQYVISRDTSEMSSDLIILSSYITRMQLERGKTTGHMNGNTVSEDDFKKIHSDTNAILENIKHMHVPFANAKKLVDELVSNEKKLSEIRALRSENNPSKIDEVAKFYSMQVETVLKIYDNVRAVTLDPKIVNALTSLYELESTKETAGKLRAKLNSVFDAKKILTDTDYQKASFSFIYIANKLSEKNINYLYGKTNSNLSMIKETQ